MTTSEPKTKTIADELAELLRAEGELNDLVSNELDPLRKMILQVRHMALMKSCRILSRSVRQDPAHLREFQNLY